MDKTLKHLILVDDQLNQLVTEVQDALTQAKNKLKLDNSVLNKVIDIAAEKDEATKLIFENIGASSKIAGEAVQALKGVADANSLIENVGKYLTSEAAVTSGDALEIFLLAGTYISSVPGPSGQLGKFFTFYSDAYKAIKANLLDLAYSNKVFDTLSYMEESCKAEDDNAEEAWKTIKPLFNSK